MAFGEYDLVVNAEMPSDKGMAGVVLAVSGLSRTSSCETTKLLTMDQAVTAMNGAQGMFNGYGPQSPSFQNNKANCGTT